MALVLFKILSTLHGNHPIYLIFVAALLSQCPSLKSFSSPIQSLLELHKRRKAVTEPEARYYMTQLLKGIQYLHNNKVIHRDLKLGNIFLNDDMDVKIGNLLNSA